MDYTGTYSPEDNKLRFYASSRLDAETYAKVKGAGFIWAPKQELFVAPMWTPAREDLLLELCGEIGDEDTSLVERAEERAERFEDYSDARAVDYESAHKAVEAITEHIPLGQPILVGHHSEKHARKDAAKIQNGMERAVRMWEQSKYWEDRAKGAIRHAKYKERPDVRARRIKGLDADLRKQEKNKKDASAFMKMWENMASLKRKDGEPLTAYDQARYIANYDSISKCFPLAEYPREAPASQYESWMSTWSALDGIITPDQAKEISIDVHQKMIARCERWIAHISNRLTYEKAMQQESGGTATDKKGPEKGGACRCWCSPGYGMGWSIIQKVNKVSVTVLDNWGNGGKDFTRNIPFDKLTSIMTAEEVQEKRDTGMLINTFAGSDMGFFLRDASTDTTPIYKPTERPPEIDAMKDAIKEGVKVIVTPQLFPTPPEIATKMVELAEIEDGQRILEPSAGTGNLIRAMGYAENYGKNEVVAVEINYQLGQVLRLFEDLEVHQTDFLTCNGDYGTFDRVIMNPPFENGLDIKHINHALTFLRPGGRLVALCANGPRQRAAFMGMADYWEDLPEGSFKDQGTGVNVALMVINKAEKKKEFTNGLF